MSRLPESPTLPEPSNRIQFPVLPPRRAETVHEVASAIDPGTRAARAEDAVAVFTVSAPTEDWDIPVLAVADGGNGRARGGLATTAATDTLTDALSGRMLGLDLSTRGWQGSVAEVVDAAYTQASRRVAALAAEGQGPAVSALTAALIVGDWLAVAHVGPARAYRLGRGELEQLTQDGARGALGEPAAEAPAIRFVRLRPGDVVLVCSDGLYRHVDGPELAGHLGERRPVGEIAATLVALAKSRGADDNVAVCLARIGRTPARPLPEPEPLSLRLSDQVGEALLPTYAAPGAPWWRRAPVRAVAGLVLLAAAGAAGVRGWQALASRPVSEELRPGSVERETLGTRGGDVAQAPAAAPPPRDIVQPPADSASPAAQVPLTARTGEAREAPPTRSIADSIAEARAEAARMAPIRERARRDSIAAAKVAEEERMADSIAAAALVAQRDAAAQRARDSAAAVARRAREDSIARARQLADEREREAAAREEAARVAREREARVTAGRRQLELWLATLVGAIESGNPAAPVLRQGPPRFAEFVGKNQPDVADARLVQVTVNEATGTANAEFVLKWKTEFGTASTRRVRATATVVPAGEGWQVRGWQILDGAP
jgi:protein phosphatase